MSGLKDVEFVKASAGSGKTYSITGRIAAEIKAGKYGAEEVLATTFTVKAANELESRIRTRLLAEDNLLDEAGRVRDALIGTVNSVCGRLLSEQAIAAGESPNMTVLPDESASLVFTKAIATVLERHTERMNALAGKVMAMDWPGTVRKIIGIARTTGVGADGLAASKAFSIAEAKKIYPGTKSITPETVGRIIAAARTEIDGIANVDRAEAKEAGHLMAIWDWCHSLQVSELKTWRDLKMLKLPQWPDERRKKARALAAPVEPLYQELLRNDVLLSAELQKDVTDYIAAVFEVAAEAMSAYARYKREYGLIDFVDQEVKVLDQLKHNAEFRDAVRERIKAIYVDEFQDTNPVQLAVYLALDEVVGGKTTWVGDPKQAIYRFRGADTQFMAKVMDAIPAAHTEQLPSSWRSRENLVAFTNEVFAKVFPALEAKNGVRLGIDPGEVGKEKRKGGTIAVWQIETGNVEGYSACLANRIAEGFKSGRWQSFGRVAVLFHDNSDCKRLAKELEERGVPTSIGGGRLRDDLIANLAMYAYRYVYSRDAVARAVLAAYRPGIDPEPMDDPFEIEAYTPLELFEKAVAEWKVADYARGSDAQDRGLATIESLRRLCREYEGACKVCGISATHAGFIQCFLQSETKGASAAGCDCVQLCTYHGAKGLEWETVILGDLNEVADGSPFGIRSVQEGEADAAEPLQNRVVRCLVTPFGDRRKDECGPFNERGSNEYREMYAAELAADEEEMRRLMYVGVTRAKSEVIFAPQLKVNYSRSTPRQVTSKTLQAKWMELLTDQIPFGELLGNLAAKWTIGTKEFVVSMETVEPGDPICLAPSEGYSDKTVAAVPYAKAKVSPSSLEGLESTGRKGSEIALGGAMPVPEHGTSADLGDSVHAYLAVAVPGADNRELAARLLADWNVATTVLSPDALVAAGGRLRSWIDGTLSPTVIRTELPMRFNHPNGEVSDGFIDMLVEKPDGTFVIIDHKVIGNRSAESCVKTYAAQQEIYRNAVRAACGKVSQVYLHLPVQGKLVEIVFNEGPAEDD